MDTWLQTLPSHPHLVGVKGQQGWSRSGWTLEASKNPPSGPGIGPGSEVLGISPYPPAYEFCGGMAYCGPQVGLSLVPQVGMDILQPEGQAGARVESNSERACSGPCTARPSAVKLEKVEPSSEESQDMKRKSSFLQKELEQFAKLLKQKRITLGYTQADVGLTLGVLFGKTFSQTAICRFEALQLSLKNILSCGPCWRSGRRKLTTTRSLRRYENRRPWCRPENNVRWNLENVFLQCPKPSLQQITDVVRVFCNRCQKPFPGRRRGAMSFPLPPLPHFGAPGYGSPHFTTLYSVPFPEGEAFPSVPITALGSPTHSN